MRAPSEKALVAGLSITVPIARRVRAAIKASGSAQEALERAEKVLHEHPPWLSHGVEYSMRSPNNPFGFVLLYINTGETYDCTLKAGSESMTISLGSWGDTVEHW